LPGSIGHLYTIDGVGSKNFSEGKIPYQKIRNGVDQWTSVTMDPRFVQYFDYWWGRDRDKGPGIESVGMPDLKHGDFFGAMDRLNKKGKVPPGMNWNIPVP